MNFVKDLEMIHIIGAEGVWGHVICVIMTHCVRKSIDGSHLILHGLLAKTESEFLHKNDN